MNEAWEITIQEDRTNWRALPLVFIVVLFLLLVLGGIVSFIMVGEFFPSFGLFNQMLFLSLAVSFGVSFGNRLRTIHVSNEEHSQKEIRNRAVSVIESLGFRCYHQNKKCTLRNNRRVHRLFSDWLGTEQIIIIPKEEGILLTGPGRYMNDLNWRFQKESDTK